MGDSEAPCIFYYYIHYMLYKKYGEKEITIKKAKDFLYEWRILKIIRPIIIKELEIFGLIESVNKKKIKIKTSNFSEDGIGKIYKQIGLY